MNTISSRVYPWKRFWRKLDGSVSLGDRGYLSNPDGEYGELLNPDIVALDSQMGKAFVAMLGEPGMGKSQEFNAAYCKDEEASRDTDDLIHFFCLSGCDNSQALQVEAFRNDEVTRWKDGNGTYTLYLDSLDEGILEVSNLASIIAREMKRMRPFAERFRLRIACRSTDFGSTIRAAAEALWLDAEAIEILELAPLRRADVVEAARLNSLDGEEFARDVAERDLEAFAMTPVSLNFLIDLKLTNGELPRSKSELYEGGCQLLASELSDTRQDAKHFGQLSVKQRLDIAGRIAFFSILSGHNFISIGTDPTKSSGSLSVSELAGGTELVNGSSSGVSEDMVREVVSTALFNGRGERRLSFRHQTYMEYLAARYFDRSGLSTQQIKSLLFGPSGSQKVVPQLSQVAAWNSVDNEQIRELILEGDPQVLLLSDLSVADDEFRLRLLQRLGVGLANGELDDSGWIYRGFYRKLKCNGIEQALSDILCDPSQNRIARRFACDVAEECCLPSMKPLLLERILDENEYALVCNHAAHAFVASEPANEELLQLIPLAKGSKGDDQDDDLRGIALSALWPRRLIDVEELFFECIAEPKQPHYGGEYCTFLHQTLAKSLQVNELKTALLWAEHNLVFCDKFHAFHYVIEGILERCFRLASDLEIRTALSSLVRSAEYRYRPILLKKLKSIETDVRRAFAARTIFEIDNIDDRESDFPQLCLLLFVQADTPWLIEQTKDVTDVTDKRVWVKILERVYRHSDETFRDDLAQLAIDDDIVAESFIGHFGPVKLDSIEADEMRRHFLQEQEFASREKKISEEVRRRRGNHPPTDEQVEKFLTAFENGDRDGWWKCVNALRVSEGMIVADVVPDDVTTFPGWKAADEITRSRIIAAAKVYLSSFKTNPHQWIHRVNHYTDRSAYQAMVLLDRHAPGELTQLPNSVWREIAGVMLCFPTTASEENDSFIRQKRFVKMAYQREPQAVLDAAYRVIESRNLCNTESDLGPLGRLGDCWDNRLRLALGSRIKQSIDATRFASKVFRNQERGRRRTYSPRSKFGSVINRQSKLLQKGVLAPKIIGQLLKLLISNGCFQSAGTAKKLVGGHWRDPEMACEAANTLWYFAPDRGVKTLLRGFQANRSFRRRVLPVISSGFQNPLAHESVLSESQVADLFRHCMSECPYEDDPKESGARNLMASDEVRRFRDGLLERLRQFGTRESCHEIERLVADFPNLDFLPWTLRASRRTMLQKSWLPIQVKELSEMLQGNQNRLVRSEFELQQAVLESLNRLQIRFSRQTPAIRDVWDYHRGDKTWEPVSEEDFSDYLQRHLKSELQSLGIISLREVQVRQRGAEGGEDTDLYVTAFVESGNNGEVTAIRIIVEVKCCWNPEVDRAMEDQLLNRYLKNTGCLHGIYVVAWFLCDQWNREDSRRNKTRKKSAEEKRLEYAAQAKSISVDGFRVESFVFDLPMHG